MSILKIFFLGLMFFCNSSYADLQINIVGEESSLFSNYIKEIKKALPEKIKNDLNNKTITVQFKNMQENIAGKTQRYKIQLSTHIRDAILSKSVILITRTHKTAYREAQATLLHEITHVWDNLNIHTDEEKQLIDDCQDLSNQNERSRNCIPYKNMHYSLSQNLRFLYLSGWLSNLGSLNRATGLKHRSPDVYEGTNPQEFFAVNMEYFLIDPSYQCRRPLLYQFLKKEFNHQPFVEQNCETKLNYLTLNSETQKLELEKIDLNRLYQVHYFMAGKGKAAMSRFGHSMIRLVICASNTPFGPKCLEDLSSHIILSYRAIVTTAQVNNLDGLTGKYPSRLFFLKLSDVVDEYTKGDLRDLISVPLKISKKEMHNIVLRALELHWSYDGKYYFVTNNCAVEAANLIRSGIEDSHLNTSTVISPNGLLETLIRIDRADIAPLANRNEAIGKGYIFDSYLERYTLAYNKIKKFSSSADLESYFNKSAADRTNIFITSFDKGLLNKTQVASFLLLETGSLRKARTALMQSFGEAMMKSDNEKILVIKNEIKELITIGQFTSSPWQIAIGNNGYGIPLRAENEVIEKKLQNRDKKNVIIGQQELQKKIESIIDNRNLIEVKVSMENVKKIVSFLKNFK